MIKKSIFFVVLPALVFFLCAYYPLKVYAWFFKTKKAQAELSQKRTAWMDLEQSVRRELSGFKGSAGLVIKDLSTGWTITINKDRLFPSASLVKIPIMAACFHAQKTGRINMNQVVTLEDRLKTGGSGELKCMPAGKKFTIEELIRIMIDESDNTAANILIGLLDFDYLNKTFRELGLVNTNIERKMMDFQSRREGIENFTTAADLAFLLENMYAKKLINSEVSERCIDILKQQKIRDRIPARLPRDTEVAHKTGLERGVCHDVGIVFTPQGDFLISALIRHNNGTARSAKRVISHIALDVYNYKTGALQGSGMQQAKANTGAQ